MFFHSSMCIQILYFWFLIPICRRVARHLPVFAAGCLSIYTTNLYHPSFSWFVYQNQFQCQKRSSVKIVRFDQSVIKLRIRRSPLSIVDFDFVICFFASNWPALEYENSLLASRPWSAPYSKYPTIGWPSLGYSSLWARPGAHFVFVLSTCLDEFHRILIVLVRQAIRSFYTVDFLKFEIKFIK